MCRLLAVATFLLMMGLATPEVNAQDATPAGGLVAPDPEACQVQPRTVENLLTFLATPSAGTASPTLGTATPEVFAAPRGEPADEEIVAGVSATAIELYACYNANAFLRVFALFTDQYLARSIAEEGITADAVGLLGTPIAPQAVGQPLSVAVQDVRVRPDGRVGAYLVRHSPMGDGGNAVDYYIFVEQDGRYLIDDVVLLPAEGE